ncbi:serine/threonine-protein kinase, partial [Nocardioides sp.]|uniref:serine/threonine-protein kinase n=1 Tax=Nocardioides sp. TaxID=35761 RepID=UPI002719F128
MTSPPLRLGGRFEIRTQLGRGGMADVYLAHDHVLRRDVAIKMLRDVTEVDRDRFASEAQLLSLLSHESIVTLYDASVADGRPWLALELVEGRTMSDLLRDGTMAPRPLAALAAQVAAGLAHAHTRGVVHRDVKPSNVLVSPDGRARLTDFGIARLVDSDDHLTLTGHVVGTAAYIAPEQVRGEQVTGAADVYALGLLLLEALTGQRSFAGPPMEAALARLHQGPLIPTSLPPGWSGLLAAMTALKPEARPTAQLAAHRLQELSRERADAPTSDRTALLPVTTVVAPVVA